MHGHLVAALSSVMVAACGESNAARDLASDRGAAAARQAEVAQCSTSPAAASAPECLAALKAEGEAESQRALTIPPRSRIQNAGHL